MEGISAWEEPYRVQTTFSWIFLKPGEQGMGEEGNKLLHREVNHKLGRGTQFWGLKDKGK